MFLKSVPKGCKSVMVVDSSAHVEWNASPPHLRVEYFARNALNWTRLVDQTVQGFVGRQTAALSDGCIFGSSLKGSLRLCRKADSGTQ